MCLLLTENCAVLQYKIINICLNLNDRGTVGSLFAVNLGVLHLICVFTEISSCWPWQG